MSLDLDREWNSSDIDKLIQETQHLLSGTERNRNNSIQQAILNDDEKFKRLQQIYTREKGLHQKAQRALTMAQREETAIAWGVKKGTGAALGGVVGSVAGPVGTVGGAAVGFLLSTFRDRG